MIDKVQRAAFLGVFRAAIFRAALCSLLLATVASDAFAQPEVLFKVVMKKNGSTYRTENPVSTFTDTSTSGTTTYYFAGDATTNPNILDLTLVNSIYGWAGNTAPGESATVDVYVKGTPTATVQIDTAMSLSTMSTGTPLAESSSRAPFTASGIKATKPNGVTGTYTNSGTEQTILSRALACTSNAEHDGCTTFAAYPGVTYCIPDGAWGFSALVGTKNTGSWQSWVDISATLGLTVEVTLGADLPIAYINGPQQGGVPVATAAVNTLTTMYNDSYDPDDDTSPREGICSASWEVLNPSNAVVATGTNIASIQFTPTTTGTYTVNLSVTDNEGNVEATQDQFLVQ